MQNPEDVGEGCDWEELRGLWPAGDLLCKPPGAVDLGLGDLSGLFPSRFSDSTNGGWLDALLHVATHLRLLVRASCLYLDGVRRVRALLLLLTHIHIYCWLCCQAPHWFFFCK